MLHLCWYGSRKLLPNGMSFFRLASISCRSVRWKPRILRKPVAADLAVTSCCGYSSFLVAGPTLALAVGAGLVASVRFEHHPSVTACAEVQNTNLRRLNALNEELQRIAAATSGCVGFSATNIDDEALHVEINGQSRFPMASTYKVPLAVTVLRLVDAGTIKLEDKVHLDPSWARPGTGVVTAQLLERGEAEFTIFELLELALNDSDNTGSDYLFHLVGGPSAVHAQMRGLGLQTMNISRTCVEHIADKCGVSSTHPANMVEFIATLEGRMECQPLSCLRASDGAFDADERDTTSPQDMTRLLCLIWKRQVGLSEQSIRLLLDVMSKCRTGACRIPGRLPSHMAIGKTIHKTGSLGGRTNDVGFLVLPNGHIIALSCYIMGGPGQQQTTTQEMYDEREKVIADMARACYDFFLFHS